MLNTIQIELANLKTLITKINLQMSSATVLGELSVFQRAFNLKQGSSTLTVQYIKGTAFCPVSTRYQYYLPATTTNNVSKHCQISWGGQNHSWLGSTYLQVGLKFFCYITSYHSCGLFLWKPIFWSVPFNYFIYIYWVSTKLQAFQGSWDIIINRHIFSSHKAYGLIVQIERHQIITQIRKSKLQ